MKRGLRYLLVPAVALVALAAMLSAMVSVWRFGRPDAALAIHGNDGVAAMRHAELELKGAEDPVATVRDLVPSARAAIKDTPLNPAAISLLATAAFAEDRRDAGLRLLKLSEQLSRRDLRTHLVLIENAVARGDIVDALKHYDLALSTNDQAGELLFPVLTRAIATPEVRDGLVPYVRRDPNWLRGFLVASLAGSGDPAHLSQLVRRAGGLPPHPDYRDFETQILWSLARRGDYNEARAFFLTLAHAREASLRSVALSRANADSHFGPLAWYLVDRPEVSAELEAENRLWVRVAAGQRGLAAQKLLYLPPGRYRFSGQAKLDDGGAGAALQLWCARAGGERLLWESQLSGDTPTIAAQWLVPADCAAQRLMLNAVGADQQADAELRLSDLKLTPLP